MPKNLRALAGATIAALLGGGSLFLACSPAPPGGAVVSPTPVTPVGEASRTGRITCGSGECSAPSEICCMAESPRCIPTPDPPPIPKGSEYNARFIVASQRWRACGRQDFRACDDAGDCAAGETCCAERELESDGVPIWHGVCSPLRAGKVSCSYAELCSDDDPTCVRKGNVCRGDPGEPRNECAATPQARRKPLCGSAPCQDGMTCVETGGKRACVQGESLDPWKYAVIECDRGRDCGEDESCFTNPQRAGHRCDWDLQGIDAMSEQALCDAPEDCVASCRHAPASIPSCYIHSETKKGRCECLSPCKKDDECEDCTYLVLRRGEGELPAEPFCDLSRSVCDCRSPAPSP